MNEKIVRNLEATGKTYFVWDEYVKGFGVQVSVRGTKSYVVKYRDRRKITKRQKLGRVESLSLKEARERAQAALVAARSGVVDPVAQVAGVVSPVVSRGRVESGPESLTVGEGARRYRHYLEHEKAIPLKPKTLAGYDSWLRNHVYPREALGALPIQQVMPEDIERQVAGLSWAQRNAVLRFLRAMWNWYQRRGWVDGNPALAVDRAREVVRDRMFSEDEMRRIGAALEMLSVRRPVPVLALKLAAITGQRINEVLMTRWEDVDMDSGRWVLPDSKTGRRVHYMPETGRALLKETVRVGDYVCFGQSLDKPLGYVAVSRAWRYACDMAGVEDARIHDLRRTIMTRAGAKGYGVHQTRDLVGHADASAAERYVRTEGKMITAVREDMGADMAGLLGV